MTIQQLTDLARNSAYNDANKKKFASAAKKFLRDVAKAIGADTQDVRYNRGGIAVAGDAVLHTDRWYLHIAEFCYFRTVTSRKDYVGGPNQKFNVQHTAADVARMIIRQENATPC